ncbi:MAG: hypothetical protein HDQ88_03845 [Clostridia bacterium]|nr:hypothetical protein [Clostridia bacterium]
MKKIAFMMLMVLSAVCFAEKMAVSGNAIYVDIDDSISAGEWGTKQMACYVVNSGQSAGDLTVTLHTWISDITYVKSGGQSVWIINDKAREDWTLERVKSWVLERGEQGYGTDCARLALQYIDVLD